MTVEGWLAIIGAVAGAVISVSAAMVPLINAIRNQTAAVDRASDKAVVAATKAEQAVDVAATAAATTDKKLDEIHVQTNSNLTELKRSLDQALERIGQLETHIAASGEDPGRV